MKMTMDSKKAFTTATIVLILLAAVFLTLGTVVAQIDTTGLAPQLVSVVDVLKGIFTYGPVAMLSAFLFGMFGYLKNIFKLKAKEAPETIYNINKTLETIMYFLSAITPVIAMLSVPPISVLYPEAGAIGTVIVGAVAAVIKIVKSQLKDLNEEKNGS